MISRSFDKMEKISTQCIKNDNERQTRIKIISFDLSIPESIDTELIPRIKAYAKDLNTNGSIDLLVNNAGGGKDPSGVKSSTLKTWNFAISFGSYNNE